MVADRSTEQVGRVKHGALAEYELGIWSRLIELCVHEAKQTRYGLPTDNAILSRWWIAEHRPLKSERVKWMKSFECVCEWLKIDPVKLREKLLADIDESLWRENEAYVRATVAARRAMVLACAGVPTSIEGMFVLPLVSKADWERVANVDHGEDYSTYGRRVA